MKSDGIVRKAFGGASIKGQPLVATDMFIGFLSPCLTL